jgi:hypothetical protein
MNEAKSVKALRAELLEVKTANQTVVRNIREIEEEIRIAQRECEHQWGAVEHWVDYDHREFLAYDNGETGLNWRGSSGEQEVIEFDCWKRTCLKCDLVDEKRRKKIPAPETAPPFPED